MYLQVRLDEGMYAPFLADWLRVFPRDQILFLRFEDYSGHEGETINKIARFLGISKKFEILLFVMYGWKIDLNKKQT